MLPRDYIARCAAHYPDRIAYHDGDRALNWRQIHARSDRLAAALQALGLKKGDVAAILSHEHLEVYEHLYACYKTGLLRCGINWRYAPREMLHVIRDSNARVILVQANCVPLLAEILDDIRADGRILIGYGGTHGLEHDYETLIDGADARPRPVELTDDDLIALSYTSGTTGLPKGVMLTPGRHARFHAVHGAGHRAALRGRVVPADGVGLDHLRAGFDEPDERHDRGAAQRRLRYRALPASSSAAIGSRPPSSCR